MPPLYYVHVELLPTNDWLLDATIACLAEELEFHSFHSPSFLSVQLPGVEARGALRRDLVVRLTTLGYHQYKVTQRHPLAELGGPIGDLVGDVTTGARWRQIADILP